MSKQSKKRSDDHSREDLHGNAPDCSEVVLLLVDVINDLDFPQNGRLVRESQKLSTCIARLKDRCKRASIPTIYVNDNFGKWRSEFSEVVRHCLRPDTPGRSMVEALLPEQQDMSGTFNLDLCNALYFCTNAKLTGSLGMVLNDGPERSCCWSSTLRSQDAKLTLTEAIAE